MSEKKISDKAIDDQAWVAWLEWHKDIPAHQIPMMPETFRKAFREGARWMESKGGRMSEIGREMAIEGIERSGMNLTGKISQDQAMKMLVARLTHARKEHPVFAENNNIAWGVICDELYELADAIFADEGPARILDEALDVAATAMRLVMGEVQG